MPRKKARPEPFKVTGSDVRVRVAEGPRADGRWRWRADYQEGSKRPTVWSGWGTQEEAEAAVLEVLRKPEIEQPPEPELSTVRDLLCTWTAAVDAREDISEHTRTASTTASKRLLKHGLDVVKLTLLDRGPLERWRDAELRMGAAGSTVMRDLKRLRQAWEWAREQGEAPNRSLPRVRVEQRARKAVYTDYTPTRAEIGRLLDAVHPAWVRHSLILLASTGARIGEIASLTWEAVTPACDWIEVEGKTGPRKIPLHPTVQIEVQRWERGDPKELVLGVTKNTATAHTQRELARASLELGLPRVSPNGLRRAMVDALYEAGEGPDVEAALLGHSAQTALATYRKVREGRRAAAVSALSAIALPTAPAGDVLPFPGTDLSADLSGSSKK